MRLPLLVILAAFLLAALSPHHGSGLRHPARRVLTVGFRASGRTMQTKLQQLRKEQKLSKRFRKPRGYRLSNQEMRKLSEKQSYGTLGPASPVRRIDPATGEMTEIIPANSEK